ncbi:hypothetical protein A6D6_01556 [Alcanivorax xiamenensis]|uniref:Secreted protein n=1 Tax=Alcanivorax xiamenensis TaxID=1177156 RepID=A0ABQ6YA16_9GAMM|nr:MULTISPECIES: hypothetical protein [Alcanivorax]KAF0806558.1 hypothetical protein A6D6_01556 [Alcanivorax xiamenensis]
MRLPIALLTAGLLAIGAVHADGYDYIRGDDVYEEDYNYGLNYEGLSSTPRTRLQNDDSGSRGENPMEKHKLEIEDMTGAEGQGLPRNTAKPFSSPKRREQPKLDLPVPGR